MRKVIHGLALAVATASVALATACAGNKPPPTAKSVLTGDGYSVLVNESPKVIHDSFGEAAPYIAPNGVAAGERGSTLELVIVADTSADAQNVIYPALSGSLKGAGVSCSLDGVVTRCTGPVTANWVNGGQ